MPDASGATAVATDASDTRLLLTASEAYPELERLFLNAKREICLSFRIFDPLTRLRTDEAREIGDTWMTLIAHTLDRGVRLRILIADFDPVLRPELHRGCWASVRAAVAAGRHLFDASVVERDRGVAFVFRVDLGEVGPGAERFGDRAFDDIVVDHLPEDTDHVARCPRGAPSPWFRDETVTCSVRV